MDQIHVLYDNWCPKCSRFMTIVEKLDWLNRINAVELRGTLRDLDISNLHMGMAKKQMASLYGNKWRYGFDSLFIIFLQLPILWFIIPFLWIFKITYVGSFLYNELAVRRKIIPLHCETDGCKI